MRKVGYKPRADNAINKIAAFIESKNTPGSGGKWINEIIEFVYSYSQLNIKHPLCHNAELARKKHSCIIFKDKWVIAFKQTQSTFIVYQIIWGPNLQ